MIARFCSQCGEPLPSPPPVTCAACESEHWRNAKPASCAVVLRGQCVLLARRAIPPWRNAWCVPGGFCDQGEHPIDTAERETLEETGVRIRVTGWLGIWIALYADDQSDSTADEISVAYYLAEPVQPDAGTVDAETAEVGWFRFDGLPEPLAPPELLPTILGAARASVATGGTTSPLPDRPLPAS